MNGYNIKSIDAFNREAEEFEALKQQRMLEQQLAKGKLSMLPYEQQKIQAEAQALAEGRGGNIPATIQITNEIDRALKSGDIERANRLMQVHKTFDRGIVPFANTAASAENQIQSNSLPSDQTSNINIDQIANALPNKMIPASNQQLPLEVQNNVLPTRGVGVMQGYPQAIASIEAAKERSKASAKPLGEADANLNERLAFQPQLISTVNQLSKLGRYATYTTSGQGIDLFRKEFGFDPRDEAIARAKYTAMVDNQVLPLLRQTFGAQFTKEEGVWLKNTLGDPNAQPDVKDAILQSFIDQKMMTIQSLQRQTGLPVSEMESLSKGIEIGGNPPPIGKYEQGEAEFNANKSKKKTVRFEDLPE